MAGEGSELTYADVERIVQLVEDGGFGLVRMDSGGLHLSLVREGYVGSEQAAAESVPSAATSPSTTSGSPATPPPAAPAPSADAAAPAESAATEVEAPAIADSAGTVVPSPVIGIFYRAPNPDSPPYVEVGQRIEAGATVGLVEIMKMYTAVTADVGGRVTEVLAGNGEQVDRGQPLVRIVEE